jgi:hypothetical protein
VCALPRLNLFNVSMLRVELALVGGWERRRSKFVITTPILSNHWKNVFMDARIENTRRKCARKLVNGLTLNILDKCRQGLNLSTKRSNALCGTSFNYSPLSTSACLLRSKSTVIAWSSSRYVWQQNIKKLMKIWGWPAPACCLLRCHEQTRAAPLDAPRGAGSSRGVRDAAELIRKNVERRDGSEALFW